MRQHKRRFRGAFLAVNSVYKIVVNIFTWHTYIWYLNILYMRIQNLYANDSQQSVVFRQLTRVPDSCSHALMLIARWFIVFT